MQLHHWVDLSKRKWMMNFLVEQNLLRRKLPLSFSHSYFVVGKSRFQTSALRLDILKEDFHVFP